MATQARSDEVARFDGEHEGSPDGTYREELRRRLADPAFRGQEGFPKGTDEAILALSDPPHYTACPNPFLEEFVQRYGEPYDPNESDEYHREPFAVDVSVGRTDALYKAHGYHTKVPHLAIVPSILHYTEPGDLVLDGFCGSGMTGVAAQWCGAAPEEYRRALDAQFRAEERPLPSWGARRAILNDLSPAATFIAANYNMPVDVHAFGNAARQLLADVEQEIGWMYETRHADGRVGRIEYTVWSEVFSCPNCAREIMFVDEALDSETNKVVMPFPCPQCGVPLTKDNLQRLFETIDDPFVGEPYSRIYLVPRVISYYIGRSRFQKEPDDADLERLRQIESLPRPAEMPTHPLPINDMYHGSRLAPKGFTYLHHMFLPRAAQAVSALWRHALRIPDPRLRQMLLFTVEQALVGSTVMNRHHVVGRANVNQPLNGVYYIPSIHEETAYWRILEGKVERLIRAFESKYAEVGYTAISTGTCASLSIPDDSIDYIFTDPPFGENIYYADLNFLVEAWHGVITDAEPEAIVDRAKGKGLPEYQGLMRRCFAEYHRVLKPGRWMTVVFHNSRNSVWNAIQEAMLSVGFVVAAVRTMDKQQGSFRQLTSTAVKQDLVISAYKPSERFEREFRLEAGTEEGAWEFVRQHLAQLSLPVEKNGVLEPVVERRPDVLFDQMVAFHVQRGATVPLSNAAFRAGLARRFIERDGMVFLLEQRLEYDRARMRAERVGQLSLFVNDEKSSIQWLRQLLDPAMGGKPRIYQEILPLFLPQLHKAEHEQLPELGDMLAQNFLEDPQGRWYVPDPNKAEDLERVRRNSLLREFNEYLAGRGRLKSFRTEAMRAGFADAYRRGAYADIVMVAERLPEAVLQEDPDLLMYYDNASLRTG